MSKKKKWVKLSLSEYNGHLYYCPVKKLPNGDKQYYFDIDLYIPEGKAISIRWPTGSVSKEKIVYSRYNNITTNNWGDKYEVDGEYAGIEFFHRGFRFWSDLDGLEIDSEVLERQIDFGDENCPESS